MEKFTFVDCLIALGFSLALMSIGIGLRVMVCGKHQTKNASKPSISQQSHRAKP
jgi:hypothetical protein